jgi:hypothetical protein
MAKFWKFNIWRAAWEACSATWNLGTNSAFALGPRKTTENPLRILLTEARWRDADPVENTNSACNRIVCTLRCTSVNTSSLGYSGHQGYRTTYLPPLARYNEGFILLIRLLVYLRFWCLICSLIYFIYNLNQQSEFTFYKLNPKDDDIPFYKLNPKDDDRSVLFLTDLWNGTQSRIIDWGTMLQALGRGLNLDNTLPRHGMFLPDYRALHPRK